MSFNATVSGSASLGLSSWTTLLCSLAVLLISLASLLDHTGRYGELNRIRATQDRPLAEVRRIKVQLDNVGRDTVQLAGLGDHNAAAVIIELERQGISINPNAPRVRP